MHEQNQWGPGKAQAEMMKAAASIGPNSSRPETDRVLFVDGLTQAQAGVNQLLDAALERLTKNIDALLGSAPQAKAECDRAETASSGRLYGLLEQTKRARSFAEQLHEQLNRLDGI